MNQSPLSHKSDLKGVNAQNQSEPKRNDKERILQMHQSSWSGISTSDGLVPNTRHSLWGGSYPISLKQTAYSTFPGDWAVNNLHFEILQTIYIYVYEDRSIRKCEFLKEAK